MKTNDFSNFPAIAAARKRRFSCIPLVAGVLLLAWTARAAAGSAFDRPPSQSVPGVVITHSPASSGLYIGSPAITILNNGDYVAAHDFFGPNSKEHERASTEVFRSTDRGNTWKKAADIPGAFWSSLFVHRGALYLIGLHRHHGHINICRSTDGGLTWTSPTNRQTGILRDDVRYHTAPVPVIKHNGRLWRAFEDAMGGTNWGERYRVGMLSAPVDADLLDAANWTSTSFLPSERTWNGGDMGGWLEGNAVLTREGRVVNVLRVETRNCPEKAAMLRISPDGKLASFDPAKGFINFPGGAKKFTIRFDAKSDLYWSVASVVLPRLQKAGRPGGIRNALALTCSPNLLHWTERCTLLYHPDLGKHGFQYVDWQFDGDDIIAACRTAYDDGLGGANNYHDANYLTFHRIANFRTKTPADSVPTPVPHVKRLQGDGWVLEGERFEVARLENGAKAFANRDYVWQGVPAEYRGWQFTRLRGGERMDLTVKAEREVTLYLATAVGQSVNINLDGWTQTAATFSYGDPKNTKLTVLTRRLKAGEELWLPQGNWTGGLLLWPANGNNK